MIVNILFYIPKIIFYIYIFIEKETLKLIIRKQHITSQILMFQKKKKLHEKQQAKKKNYIVKLIIYYHTDQ